MEIMYSKSSSDLINNNLITGIYGDKIDLIKKGIVFNGIEYDDNWSTRRFLNGFKLKINDNILKLFSELEISYSLLNRKLKDLSNGQLKLILLIYSLLNIKDTIYLDYFDKGLSTKRKKRVVNYLKTNCSNIVVISNDLSFLSSLCSNLIVFKNSKIVFNDKFNNIFKTRIKLDYPPIIDFIKLANKSDANLDYTFDIYELAKNIYRSVR